MPSHNPIAVMPENQPSPGVTAKKPSSTTTRPTTTAHDTLIRLRAIATNSSMTGARLATTIARGFTLVNPVAMGDARIAAFAVLDPPDRLALLYCDGPWSRQGRGAALVRALEGEARRQGVQRLRTEASQLSRPLLQRLGWQVEASETVPYAGVLFERWRMIKALASAHG